MLPDDAPRHADLHDTDRAHDPWAHRRAEPRMFTFFWTVFLLATTVIAISAVGLYGAVQEEGARTAARMILLVAGIGVVVLWPMTRLSQSAPAPGVAWAVQDTLAVVLPLQAVIWPHIWLARWSLETAAAVSSVLTCWAVLVGGLLAVAFARRAPGAPARVAWMCVFVALPAAAPIAGATLQGLGEPSLATTAWVQMASPITAIDQLAPRRPWLGTSSITREHWVAIGLTGVGAGAMWLLALPLSRGGRGRQALR